MYFSAHPSGTKGAPAFWLPATRTPCLGNPNAPLREPKRHFGEPTGWLQSLHPQALLSRQHPSPPVGKVLCKGASRQGLGETVWKCVGCSRWDLDARLGLSLTPQPPREPGSTHLPLALHSASCPSWDVFACPKKRLRLQKMPKHLPRRNGDSQLELQKSSDSTSTKRLLYVALALVSSSLPGRARVSLRAAQVFDLLSQRCRLGFNTLPSP